MPDFRYRTATGKSRWYPTKREVEKAVVRQGHAAVEDGRLVLNPGIKIESR